MIISKFSFNAELPFTNGMIMQLDCRHAVFLSKRGGDYEARLFRLERIGTRHNIGATHVSPQLFNLYRLYAPHPGLALRDKIGY